MDYCLKYRKTNLGKFTGFTLMELIITVVVVAIVVTIVSPSFINIIREQQLTTQTNNFFSALHLARSEAIKRSSRVTLCKKDASNINPSCTTSGLYTQGWIVFFDPNNNAIIDNGEQIIKIYEKMSDDNLIISGNTPIANYISYTVDGKTRMLSGAFQAGTITICKNTKAHKIVISPTGRIRTIKEATC